MRSCFTPFGLLLMELTYINTAILKLLTAMFCHFKPYVIAYPLASGHDDYIVIRVVVTLHTCIKQPVATAINVDFGDKEASLNCPFLQLQSIE